MILLAPFTFPGGTAPELAAFLSKAAGGAAVVIATDAPDKLRAAKFDAEGAAAIKREAAPFFGFLVRPGSALGMGPRDLPVSAFPGLPKPGERVAVAAGRPGRPDRSGTRRYPAVARPAANAPLTVKNVATGALTVDGEKVGSPGLLVRGSELAKLGAKPDWITLNIPVSVAATDATPAAVRAAWADAVGAIDGPAAFGPDPKTLPSRALGTWQIGRAHV